ncbi:MAG: Txe/YoeB family addiction module toxin [Acidimicrobiia bacterium]|nr:Txe/YoeB family addiction module toxin [Acidimicrobiia bacterium]
MPPNTPRWRRPSTSFPRHVTPIASARACRNSRPVSSRRLPVAEVRWSSGALEDRAYWQKEEPRTYERVERLLADIARSPFKGVGKPEPLKGDLSGWWSRRITLEHRLVYRVEKGVIYVLQARYHY